MGGATSQIPTLRINFNLRKCIVSHCCLSSGHRNSDVVDSNGEEEINTDNSEEDAIPKCLRSNSTP